MSRHSSSASWQFERAQTAIRMRQSQARFWKAPILFVWLLSSAAYLLLSIGETGRANLPTLITATFWGAIWPWHWHLVAFRGHFYEPNPLAVWLQQYVYGNPLSSLLIEAILAGSLLAIACVAGLQLYARRRAQEPQEEHIRGVQLATSQQLQDRINGPRRWGWRRSANPARTSVAGVSLPPQIETKHIAISGATGTGKTSAIRDLLKQSEQRGDVVIVGDPECEFTPEFYNPDRGDVILDPMDARCPYWSPWLEIAEDGDAQTLATSILPDPPGGGSGNEMYFVTAARELFVTLLEKLPTKDPQELSKVLYGPLKDLLKLIENTPAASHVTADAADQRGGVLSTLQIALKGFRFLPPKGLQQWSALQWQDTRQGWLFLPSQERSRASVLSLQSVWLDSLIHRLLDTPLGRIGEKRVWIVIDELATLRRLQHLKDILTRGRKRGVAVVIGFQDVPQLRQLYGRDTTATLMAAPSTKLLLGTRDPETAKWCSDAIGSREVIYPQENETAGSADTRDSMGVSYPRKNEAVVIDSDILQLPDLHGYLIVAGYGVASVEFPYLEREEKEPGFIPRTGKQTAPPMPPTDEDELPVQSGRARGGEKEKA